MADVPETPMTRLEQYWAGILDKIEGSGGNPNYVETIEGTLANPWGNVDYVTLVHKIQSREVTALLAVVLPDGTEWILPLVPYRWYDPSVLTLVASAARPAAAGTPIPMFGGCVIYDADPDPDLYQLIVSLEDTNYQWVDAASQLSQLPTTLTLIHHTLPDTP